MGILSCWQGQHQLSRLILPVHCEAVTEKDLHLDFTFQDLERKRKLNLLREMHVEVFFNSRLHRKKT